MHARRRNVTTKFIKIIARHIKFYYCQLEEHVVVLAVDETGMIREFTSDATFLLPEVVTSTMVGVLEFLIKMHSLRFK